MPKFHEYSGIFAFFLLAPLIMTNTLRADNPLNCSPSHLACAEAELNLEVQDASEEARPEVWGIADLHAHPFANEAFGGLFFQGKTFDPNGLSTALTSCQDAHGAFGLGDLIGNAVNGRVGHKTEAFPTFKGWPRWNSINHQQVYYKWLQRAHKGGLRLMVAHAVNSEALCRMMKIKDGRTCNDMEAVDRQIDAAYALESFIAKEEKGQGWLKIVRSPAEAREAIAKGQLAMVLGIEVDTLFDCGMKGCDKAEIEAKLDHYYSRGIRHIIPVHVTDNGFGGAAMYNPYLFNYANRLVNGRFFSAEDCSQEGYTYRETEKAEKPNIFGSIIPQYPALKAFCNARSLSRSGEDLIAAMMARHMIIDVDHMSAKTMNTVLTLAEARDYPLVSGHTGFVETSAPGQKRSEAQKTDLQLRRIMRLGGIVGPILQQGNAKSEVLDGDHVNNDCDRSSKSFAQAFLYGSKVARQEMEYPAMAFGSDFNGIIESPAPRFGSDACGGNKVQALLQKNRVNYPFVSQRIQGIFDQQVTGERRFDINTDGFAHVGLLPDFIEDLSQIGVEENELNLLFRSAEAYLRTWEKAEAR